jgi:hypothetical protein
VYGLKSIWKPEYEEARLRRYGQHYRSDRNDNYNSANASLTRSLRRLEERGLVKYTYYIPAGAQGSPHPKWGYFLADHIDAETEQRLEVQRRHALDRITAQMQAAR